MATDLADPTPTGDTRHLIQPTRLTVKRSATRRWRWRRLCHPGYVHPSLRGVSPLAAKEGIEIAYEVRVRAGRRWLRPPVSPASTTPNQPRCFDDAQESVTTSPIEP